MAVSDPTAPDRPLPGASLGTAVARFWQRSFVFSGRASRSEYWWPALVNVVVLVVLYVLGLVLLLVGQSASDSGAGAGVVGAALGGVILLITLLLGLAQIVPSIAVGVRRLHDADFSGLLYLLSLIPWVGGLILLVLFLLPSNPAGRRFDRGAAVWTPQPAWTPQPIARAAVESDPFARWPAPEPVAETAPLPELAAEEDVGDPVREAWERVGGVTAIDARLSGQPSWRRIGYLLVDRADGIGVLATHGLAVSDGAAALGPGADVYLASTALAGRAATAADGWEFALVASVARRIGASGMHLPAELEVHGVLSMAVAAPTASLDWKAPDGSVGVVIGVPLHGVPESVATPAGEVRLVGIVPLRPAELERILTGGGAARQAVAGDLAALPAATLASPDRPAVG